MDSLKLLKRAVRLSKSWIAAVPADTGLERAHLRKLIVEEYTNCKMGQKPVDSDYVEQQNALASLNMFEIQV